MMDDEDDEYEDDEFFRGLKQWVGDVWTTTHADSGSDSEVTLVGGAAAPALSKDVDFEVEPGDIWQPSDSPIAPKLRKFGGPIVMITAVTTIDHYVVKSQVPGALKTLWEKLPVCG